MAGHDGPYRLSQPMLAMVDRDVVEGNLGGGWLPSGRGYTPGCTASGRDPLPSQPW